MKQIFGAIISLVGFGALVSEISNYSYSIPHFWILMIAFFVGLEMVITGLIDDAKKELREEMEELRDELKGE